MVRNPLLAAALVLSSAGTLPAQARPAADATLPDSSSILDSLRDAQARFERLRRHHLRWARGYSRSQCDEVIGRFCYWDDDEPSWKPRPEDDRVTRARHELIAQLDSAAALLPGDRWITGQRVRYLVESSRYVDALWATNQCRAERWWCHALAGFAFHVMGDFAASDSSFALSLERMPERDRCRWTDLFLVVDQDLVRRYLDAGCEARESLNQRIWWLTDPLYLVPGNERRTEHYARLVMHRMLDRSENAYGMRWGEDNRELVLRYGWTFGWERVPPSSMAITAQPSIVGHHRGGGRHFLPPAEYLDRPSSIDNGAWELDPEYPRERFAPAYASEFLSLEHQLAAFRRRDSVVLVAAFDWEEGDNGEHGGTEAALVVAPDQRVAPIVARDSVRGGVARLWLRVPWSAALVSVEALDRRDSTAARARYWADFERGFEFMLVEADSSLPQTLEDAIPLARGSATYASGEPIHLYWEIADPPPTAPHTLSLSLVKEGKSFLRQAVEWLGLANREKPSVRLGWQEAPDARSLSGRSITVRLPDDARGQYLLRMEVSRADGGNAVAERKIAVERKGERGR